MRKGLLAEWRKGLVSRGLAAAILLAVPVGVAAAIGFEGSLDGLGEGLGALASGPESSQASAEGSGSEAIDSAIAAIAAATGDSGEPADTDTPGGPGDGGSVPGANPGQPGGTGGGGDGGGGATAGGGGDVTDPPGVDLPADTPSTGGLLDEIGDALGGVLGG